MARRCYISDLNRFVAEDLREALMSLIADIELHSLPLWFSFVLCLSVTAGGLLVLFRYRQSNKSGSFHFLQYFLILLYVYGYYSLWSDILLSGLSQMENVERVATLVAQLGAPFLIVSMIMLLVWTARVQQRNWLLLMSISIGTSAIIYASLHFLGLSTTNPVRVFCSCLALVTSLLVALTLATGQQQIATSQGQRLLIALVGAAGLIHVTTFTPFADSRHFDSVFVLYFYLLNTAMVVVYTYQANEGLMQPQLTLDDFLVKHGISKREADILRGIYAGKTNKEIAGELFISLQTVKDHSSRIYQKTFVKNRAQLITLVRESQRT